MDRIGARRICRRLQPGHQLPAGRGTGPGGGVKPPWKSRPGPQSRAAIGARFPGLRIRVGRCRRRIPAALPDASQAATLNFDTSLSVSRYLRGRVPDDLRQQRRQQTDGSPAEPGRPRVVGAKPPAATVGFANVLRPFEGEGRRGRFRVMPDGHRRLPRLDSVSAANWDR